MYKSHYCTLNKTCPCIIGEDSVRKAIDIYGTSADIASVLSGDEECVLAIRIGKTEG